MFADFPIWHSAARLGYISAMKPREKYGVCPLCGRECALTFHHLIPRKLHRRAFFKKNFSREQLNQGIDVCRPCHDGIHDRYDELTLAKKFTSPEAMKADDSLVRHFAWVARRRRI